MNIFHISFVLLLACNFQVKSSYASVPVAPSAPSAPLCNFDEILAELLKADEMLKKKAELQMLYTGEKQTLLLRQDDDDDDLPYYVPAIAKVVGSVLARNVTSIIEESFGFIPPDINFDIRNVLGLIAGTITRLNPTTPPPTTASLPDDTEAATKPTNLTDSSNTTVNYDYEKLFAQALYQIYANQSNSSSVPSFVFINQNTPTGFSLPPQGNLNVLPPQDTQPVVILQNPEPEPPQPFVVPEVEVISTTFKYSEGQSITQSPTTPSPALDIDVPIYAPAYAPNYNAKTTSKPPIYAPSYDHNKYPAPTTAATLTNGYEPAPTIKAVQPLDSSSKTEAPATTTEVTQTTTDEDDYDAPIPSTDAATDASGSTSTTVDPDEDGEDY